MRLSLGEVATIAAIDETTILELKTPSTLIRIFLNPQLYLRIWLPSTLIQWIICYSVTSQDRAQFVTVNIQDGAQRNVTHFFTFCTSVSSLITRVQLNLAIISVNFNNANSGSTFWSFFPCRTEELDAINKLNEWKSAWWNNFLSETVTEEDWR